MNRDIYFDGPSYLLKEDPLTTETTPHPAAKKAQRLHQIGSELRRLVENPKFRLTVILFGLSILNPPESQHKAVFAAAFLNSHPSYPLFSAERDAVNRLDYHDFIFFSVTTDPVWRPHDMEIGPRPIVTIGFFKKVWVRVNFATR